MRPKTDFLLHHHAQLVDFVQKTRFLITLYCCGHSQHRDTQQHQQRSSSQVLKIKHTVTNQPKVLSNFTSRCFPTQATRHQQGTRVTDHPHPSLVLNQQASRNLSALTSGTPLSSTLAVKRSVLEIVRSSLHCLVLLHLQPPTLHFEVPTRGAPPPPPNVYRLPRVFLFSPGPQLTSR